MVGTIHLPIKTALWAESAPKNAVDNHISVSADVGAAIARHGAGGLLPLSSSLLVQLLNGAELRLTPTSGMLSNGVASTGAVVGEIAAGISAFGRNIFAAGAHVRVMERVSPSAGVGSFSAVDFMITHPASTIAALHRGSDVPEAVVFVGPNGGAATVLPSVGFSEARLEFDRALADGRSDAQAVMAPVLERHCTPVQLPEGHRLLGLQLAPRAVFGSFTPNSDTAARSVVEAADVLLDPSPTAVLLALTVSPTADSVSLFCVPYHMAAVQYANAPINLGANAALAEVGAPEGELFVSGSVAFTGLAVATTGAGSLVALSAGFSGEFRARAPPLPALPSEPAGTPVVTISPCGAVVAFARGNNVCFFSGPLTPIAPVAVGAGPWVQLPAGLGVSDAPCAPVWTPALGSEPTLYFLSSSAVASVTVSLGVVAAATAALAEEPGLALLDAHIIALLLQAAAAGVDEALAPLALLLVTPFGAAGALCAVTSVPGPSPAALLGVAAAVGSLAVKDDTAVVFSRSAGGALVSRLLAAGDVDGALALAVAPATGTPRLANMVASVMEHVDDPSWTTELHETLRGVPFDAAAATQAAQGHFAHK